MGDLILTTFDWVPEARRDYARGFRMADVLRLVDRLDGLAARKAYEDQMARVAAADVA